MQMEMNLYATIICMCPWGQLDGKQERSVGNKAQGLSGEAGSSGYCEWESLHSGEAVWSGRQCMGFAVRVTRGILGVDFSSSIILGHLFNLNVVFLICKMRDMSLS